MKKLAVIAFLILNFSQSFGQIHRSNCPVKEEEFTYTLSDQSTTTLRVWGSEMVQYFETKEGYTLLKNDAGYFEYAVQDNEGNLISSGVPLQRTLPASLQLVQPNLKYSSRQIELITQNFYGLNQNLNKKAGGKPFPSKGKRNVLTILIQYPDLPATIAKSNFDSMMVKQNYNGTGSFRDYYLKASYNQLELNTDVFGWYTASLGYMNYGKSNPSYNYNVGTLIKRAILAADSAGVDFSKYDNDSDGYVDGIIIVHAGIGAEEQSAPSANNFIWSHRYNLTYSVGAVALDGVMIDAYGIFPEKRYNGGSYSQVGIGVLSHEFGHLLDLPDLYSTQSKGEGAGNFSNMAGGPWLNNEKTPCLMDAWSRMALGWLNPTLINAAGTYTITDGLSDSNFAYRINTNLPNEFFLVENRQKKGFDTYLPSKGMAVWHINTNKAKLLSFASNNVNNDTSAYGVGLLQADGRRDLEKGNNRGDAGDLFPGTTNNRSIGNNTSPNTLLHYKIGGVKQLSNIIINNITSYTDSSVSFTIGNKPTASFDLFPAKGCAPLSVYHQNISSFAQSFKWKFHDGTFSTDKDVVKTFNSAGSYPVTLYVLDSTGTAIDSNLQTIQVDASPEAAYELVRSDSNTFLLTNNSKGSLYVVWRFGSNQTSTQPNPTYVINGGQDVPFMLIAYSQNQCTDTAYGIMSFWPLAQQNASHLKNEISVYPNPFEEKFDLSFSLVQEQALTFTLTDLQGKEIWKQESTLVKSGSSTLSFETGKMAHGVYLLKIEGADFNKILRVNAR